MIALLSVETRDKDLHELSLKIVIQLSTGQRIIGRDIAIDHALQEFPAAMFADKQILIMAEVKRLRLFGTVLNHKHPFGDGLGFVSVYVESFRW